jgi:methylated-DNA-[protein]-cysteine S-methyltransferase
VDAYYAGDLTAIDTVAVAQTGTALQLEGWAALRRIAAGHPHVRRVRRRAGTARGRARRGIHLRPQRPGPVRAVPSVLRTGGGLGGFAWGLDVKRALLARESVARA